MEKKLLVYLVPIVLVIGTAFGVGIVTGESEDSDVTVGVDYVGPTIEIISPETCAEYDYDADVDVEANVTAPGHENAVDEVKFTFEYVGGLAAGEAYVGPLTVEGEIDEDGWNEGEATYEGTFELPSGENMWRAGPWEITATVYGTEGDYDSDSVAVSVNDFHDLCTTYADGVASGKPGETLYGDDFSIPENENGDQPYILIRSNTNWQLDFGDGEAVHEEDSDYTLDVKGDYDQYTGEPVWMESDDDGIDINYEVYIPYGHMHGQYSTEGHDSVTHTLSSIDDEIIVEDGDSIQNAIEDAEPGDTIYVKGGTYEEMIEIDKEGLTLRGFGNPVIYNPHDVIGGTPIVEVTADNVRVEGMIISVVEADAVPMGIILNGDNGEAIDNVITAFESTGHPLIGGGGDSPVIEDNTIENGPIGYWGSGDVTIANNEFSGEAIDEGIWLAGEQYDDVVIENNDLTGLDTGKEDVKIVHKPGSVNGEVSPYGMIMSTLQENEGIDSVYLEWFEQTGTKEVIGDYVVYDSGRSDYQEDQGWPYIEYEVTNDGTIEVTFHNPTPYLFVTDYRLDGETGDEHDWDDILIGEGELEGEYIGEWYNPVTITEDTHEVTIEADDVDDEVKFGIRVGAEQNWYLGWIVFETL